MCLSFVVVEIQPILTYPTCIWRPIDDPVEFRRDLWRQKTRVSALSCGVVCVILRLAVFVEHRLVTDRQTDGRTDRRAQAHG